MLGKKKNTQKKHTHTHTRPYTLSLYASDPPISDLRLRLRETRARPDRRVEDGRVGESRRGKAPPNTSGPSAVMVGGRGTPDVPGHWWNGLGEPRIVFNFLNCMSDFLVLLRLDFLFLRQTWLIPGLKGFW